MYFNLTCNYCEDHDFIMNKLIEIKIISILII